MSDHSVFAPSERCADCVARSGQPGWDIERDVIRGRGFDGGHRFLPDGLSLLDRMRCLSAAQARRLSQIQGRTYANMVVLLERFINAKALDINLSATLERALHEEVRARRREKWLAENRDAIAAYNARIERDGMLSDHVRAFKAGNAA